MDSGMLICAYFCCSTALSPRDDLDADIDDSTGKSVRDVVGCHVCVYTVTGHDTPLYTVMG